MRHLPEFIQYFLTSAAELTF